MTETDRFDIDGNPIPPQWLRFAWDKLSAHTRKTLGDAEKARREKKKPGDRDD